MFLPGAEEQGMTQNQCLALLESVEDTIDFFVSSLTYLIHAEGQKAQPDLVLIAQWEAMDSEAFDLQYSLPGARVETYQQVLETYRQRSGVASCAWWWIAIWQRSVGSRAAHAVDHDAHCQAICRQSLELCG